MGSQDNINTTQNRDDSIIKDLHILVFLGLFFLIIFQILCIILGIGSSCCIWILIVVLLLNTVFFWRTRRIDRIKREKLAKQYSSSLEVIKLPKVYDFYCPKCLYQTNEKVRLCPNCKIGILSSTTKNPERWYNLKVRR